MLYDPFVERALEPWSFGIYAGGQSILVGTPSGVTLAPEGGAHQSITTPSIGLEQPGCMSYEPAFALDTEWCLLAALGQLGRPAGRSAYLRLSTRPVDQTLAAVPDDPAARERRRRQVVAGAYPLRRVAGAGRHARRAWARWCRRRWPPPTGSTSSACRADVVCVTSPDLLFRAVQARRGLGDAPTWVLDSVFPAERARPLVTVLDGHPHTLAFLAGVRGVPATHLGVTAFGQSGDLDQRLPLPRHRHRRDRGRRARPGRLGRVRWIAAVPPVRDGLSYSAVATVDQLDSVLATVQPLVAAVGSDQWDAATPCPGWDVRALLDHLVGGNHLYAAALAGRPGPARATDSPARTRPARSARPGRARPAGVRPARSAPTRPGRTRTRPWRWSRRSGRRARWSGR